MSFVLRWFGILFGAASLFSLAQKLYVFAAAPVIEDALARYRSSLHPIMDVVLQPLRSGANVIPLTAFADLAIVYIALGLLLLVVYIADDLEWHRSGEERVTLVSVLGRFAISVFWPLVLPAAIYLTVLGAEQSTLRSWGFEIAKVLASAAILIGANACYSALL